MITINNRISIPDDEIIITASRSSGPGGQNVNKVSTKVTLRFSIAETGSLSEEQKDRAREKLKNIINREGCIVIHEESRRSQAANRKLIIDKFASLLRRSLAVPKKRIPTRVSAAQKRKRLDDKKIQGRKKKSRRNEEIFQQ
ncbi:MAG TPA: alternative ribosome rescue aminoacyl-tRNA hydrolase ArfB [Spirochaetota bacterium]|nr:alternative ribosome rescue aminoacyl-tRNA hydrolase ArfB [Spirochaetota bacterium]HPV43166.1 alternative ribosome rescue aminoacyl-tRNA hydrolase ArfB [Spirochaetota bacterium]